MPCFGRYMKDFNKQKEDAAPHIRGQRGFSLVELSISLVIIGLLTGGILTGQSLIRAAELRQYTSDLEMLRIANRTFRDKYFALAGDMSNATDFWGAETDCSDFEAVEPGTCDGDGNGILGNIISSSAFEREDLLYYEHLSLAGLIAGSYESADERGTETVYWEAKAFRQRLVPLALTRGSLTQGNHYYHFYDTDQSVLEEFWNIDTKIDDGLPNSGRMFTTEEGDPDGYCQGEDSYLAIPTGQACEMFHKF